MCDGHPKLEIQIALAALSFRHNMAKPSDATRLDAYQDLAQRQARMTEDYAQRMSGDGAPDPQKIAEAVLSLVQMPHGTRPPRTVVDPLMDTVPAANCSTIPPRPYRASYWRKWG